MAETRSSTEIACLIFASASVTILGLGVLVFIGLTAYVASQVQTNRTIDGQGLDSYLVSLITVFVIVLIFFIFSVLLLNGTLKRRSKQVLAYIVFGVIVTVLSTCGAIFLMLGLSGDRNRNVLFGGIWLFILFVYSFILVTICMRYRSLRGPKPKKEIITLDKEDYKKLAP